MGGSSSHVLCGKLTEASNSEKWRAVNSGYHADLRPLKDAGTETNEVTLAFSEQSKGPEFS